MRSKSILNLAPSKWNASKLIKMNTGVLLISRLIIIITLLGLNSCICELNTEEVCGDAAICHFYSNESRGSFTHHLCCPKFADLPLTANKRNELVKMMVNYMDTVQTDKPVSSLRVQRSLHGYSCNLDSEWFDFERIMKNNIFSTEYKRGDLLVKYQNSPHFKLDSTVWFQVIRDSLGNLESVAVKNK